MKRLLSKDISVVIIVLFIALFLSKFPTLYHYLSAPREFWFNGYTSWFDPWDLNAFLAHINYGQRNGVFIENMYTTIEHKGEFVYQAYTLTGILNRFLGFSTVAIYSILSIITTSVIVLACFVVSKSFFSEPKERLFSFVLMVLGGGFGFLTIRSADISYGGFTTIRNFEMAHDGLSTGFYVLAITLLIISSRKNNMKMTVVSSFMAVLSILIHPALLVIYLLFPAAMGLLAKSLGKDARNYFIFLLTIILFSVIYYFSVLNSFLINPGFSGITGQRLYGKELIPLLLGFGLLSPIIMYSYLPKKIYRLFEIKSILILQIILVLSNIGFHDYFLKGMFVWGAIISVDSLRDLNRKKFYTLLLTSLIIFSLSSRIHVFNELIKKDSSPFPYLKVEEKEAINFLNTLPAESSFISLFYMGNYIPAFTDNRVYFGHYFTTPNGSEKLMNAKRFFLTMNEEEQRSFLSKNKIDYIYYGQEEGKLRRRGNLRFTNPFPYFKKIFSNKNVIVYKINQ